MRAAAALLITVLSTQAEAGPFGLEMGQSMDGLDVTPLDSSPHNFVAYKVPKPHSAFVAYGLLAPPSTGLCRIIAVGKDIETSSFGLELQARFDKIASQIDRVYGPHEKKDFLFSGSVWDDRDDWMMALKRKERVLQASWDEESGAKLKDGIVEILLTAVADRMDTGSLRLQYRFTNTEACETWLDEESSDAF